MEELNLMEFNSPGAQTNLNPSVIVVSNVSPGNNPFDSVLKCANDFCNSPSKICNSFQPSSNITDDFFKLVDIKNCGRESVGCFWDDFSPRESLGILKLDALNYSFNPDNLSVPVASTPQFSILEEQKSKDISNSPLNTAFLHPLSYCLRKQSILSSNSSVSTNRSLLFNSGSLEGSEPSKIYSLNSTKNYDINVNSNLEDDLNNAFLRSCVNNSTSFFDIHTKDINENRERLLSLPEMRKTNIPKSTQNKSSDLINKNDMKCGESLKNECEIEYVPFRNIINGSFTEVVKDMDETFNDSVFIEGNHLASNIADGLIEFCQSFDLDSTAPPNFADLDESNSCDLKIDTKTVFKVIDKMLPVQQNSDIVIMNEKSTDIPTYSENASVDNVCCVTDNNRSLHQGSNYSTANITDYKETKKNISNRESKNKSEICSINGGSISSSGSSGKSKDANELLQDLSEIINSEYKDKQKMKGQKLLSGLADILCSNNSKVLSSKYDNLEDSGHSSIEHDDHPNDEDIHACYEVLDLRVLASKSNENQEILDLSMASKVENTNKRLSQSFSFSRPKFPPTKLINILTPHTSLKSSTSSLEASKSDASKLKPKKSEDKSITMKKGPLKAVIPLGDMSRRKSFSKTNSTTSTPPKVEQTSSSLFKVKKTSTPTGEPKLKPLAQSTPDSSKPALDRSRPISCSSQLKKRKFYCPVSPLARPTSIGSTSANSDLNKSNHSGSAPNLSGSFKKTTRENSSIPSPKPMYRRHSATELKASEITKLKRSYSIGKEFKTPSMLSKVKENVSAALSNAKRNSLGSPRVVSANQKNSILHERNSGISSNTKSLNLLGRLRKSTFGKENNGK